MKPSAFPVGIVEELWYCLQNSGRKSFTIKNTFLVRILEGLCSLQNSQLKHKIEGADGSYLFFSWSHLQFFDQNSDHKQKALMLVWPTVRRNCSSDWEKFWNLRLKAKNLQNIWDHLNNLFKQWKVRTISGCFWQQSAFLTGCWKFLTSKKLNNFHSYSILTW